MTKTVTVNKTTNVVEVQSSGTVGPQGSAGATGAQGPQGPQGPAGAVNSVAVTGTDGVQVDSGSPITTSSGTITLGINKSTLLSHINVEDGATADQTGAQIKTAYEAESNTNAFTDAEKTKLTGVAEGATAVGPSYFQTTGSTSNSSSLITNITTTNISAGDLIEGTNIPSSMTVNAIVSAGSSNNGQIQIAGNATGTGSVTLTFYAQGSVFF